MATIKETATLPHTSERSEEHETTTGQASPTLVGTMQSAEQSDTVGFRDEGKFLSTTMDVPREDMSLMGSLRPSEEERHNIASFLARPVKIATISWTATATEGQMLGTYDIIKTIKTKNFNVMRQKISGFYGMHATANLKILVNAQPFQQGLLQIVYIPFERTFTSYPSAYKNSLAIVPFTTGCPNTIVNIATQSGATLSIPYTGPNAFVRIPSLEEDNRDWGTFYVQNLASLSDSSNAAKAQISVYMYFTNVRLFGATPLIFSCQMDRSAEEECKVSKGTKGGGSALSNLVRAVPDVLDALGLSKPVANQNPSRMLLNPYANFVCSNSTSAALKVSASEQQAVTIGQLGVDKDDEMDIRKIVSKPCYQTKCTWKTTDTVGARLLHITVEPNCSLTSSTKIDSVDYTVACPTRLRYVAELFKFWRGDIIYTLHIVGTKFHSGRLRLVYNIGGALDDKKLGELYPYTFSQVIDIRDGMSFDVVCPYFCSTPWRDVPRKWDAGLNRFVQDHQDDFDDPPNNLQIYVENELLSATSTSSSIIIWVTSRGGDNIEFAGPTTPRSLPFWLVGTPDAAPSRKRRDVKEEPIDYPDTGSSYVPSITDQSTDPLIAPSTESDEIPVNTPTPNPRFRLQGETDMKTVNMVSMSEMRAHALPMNNKLAMGETITNLRPLLRRYFPVGLSICEKATAYTYVMYPFAMIEPSLGDTTKQNEALTFEYLHYISYLYRFYRGGMRHMIKTVGNPEVRMSMKFDPDIRTTNNDFVISNEKTDSFGKRSPIFKCTVDNPVEKFHLMPYAATQPSFVPLTGGMEFEIPYYAKIHKSPVKKVPRDANEIINAIDEAIFPEGKVIFQVDFSNMSGKNFVVEHYRSAADDFNFGFLLGAPVTTIQTTKFPI